MLFKTHPLSEQSTLEGMILTDLQVQVLENRMAELATEIVNASATETDRQYFEKLNFQKGQLREIQNMLVSSEQASAQLKEIRG